MFIQLIKSAGISLLLMFCFCDNNAQHAYLRHKEQKQIEIGDTIPNLMLSHFLAQPDRQVPVAQFYQQGLLIINFWATWCATCIREFPVLDAIAGKNKTVKVLAVAYEPEDVIGSFLKKQKNLPRSNLNMITEDTLLQEYFRHRGLPHNIWVDNKGVVRYITGPEGVTEANVAKFLAGKPFEDVETKKDLMDFNMLKPFHLRDSSFSFRSILTNYTPGIGGSLNFSARIGSQENRYVDRFFVANLSLNQILWFASDLAINLNWKDYYHTMEIVTKDSVKFFYPEDCPNSFVRSKYRSEYQWKLENTFVYEQITPKAFKDSTFSRFILQDLAKYFHLSYTTKSKPMFCTVLRLTTEKNSKPFKRAVNDSAYISFEETGLYCHNVTLKRVMDYLNKFFKDSIRAIPLDPPYINQTGIDYPIDLVLPCSNRTRDSKLMREFKAILSREYGVAFSREIQPYPVFVVKDEEN